jgi:Fe-S-cluster formation regulator IscX/YfhJ
MRFYVFKTLTPSHSVYNNVPPPETDREKKIYEDLIKKIGFFEVIEQLVVLESDFDPTASREELLEKINQAWNRDIGE